MAVEFLSFFFLSSRTQSPTHLSGLNVDATEAQVKSAYKKLALKNHPDKNPIDKEGANARFQRISEAYKRITDPSSFEDNEGFEMDEEAMNAVFAEMFGELFGLNATGVFDIDSMMDEMILSDEDNEEEDDPLEVIEMMQEMMELRSDSGNVNEDDDFPSYTDINNNNNDNMMMMMMHLMSSDVVGDNSERNVGESMNMKGKNVRLELKNMGSRKK